MFDLRINILKILCVILQTIGVICLLSIKIVDPAWSLFLWAVVAISGFAALVQMMTDKHSSVFGHIVGIAGLGILLAALFELAPQ